MAGPRFTRTYRFVEYESPEAAKRVGIDAILSPVMPIEFVNVKMRERFVALVDSGADYSYLPFEAAQILGIAPDRLAGPTITNQGIGGTVRSRFAMLDCGIITESEEVD